MSRSAHVKRPFQILIGIVALTVSSWIAIPFEPVPVTLQTAVILFLGVYLGRWTGTACVLIWMALAALGLPLLADGKGGLSPFTGPTAGFLWSFPLACFLAGYLPNRQSFEGFGRRLIGAILLHGLILVSGFIWLAQSYGMVSALNNGVWPFLPGVVIKSLLVAALVGFLPRLKRI